MAYKRVILDSANSDRSAIVEQLIAATGGKLAAASFLDDVDKTVDLITEFPTMFALSRFDSLAKRGYRSALVGSYVLLYRFEGDTVYIAHIFHQRQDYATLV